jgi:hypothetical protein
LATSTPLAASHARNGAGSGCDGNASRFIIAGADDTDGAATDADGDNDDDADADADADSGDSINDADASNDDIAGILQHQETKHIVMNIECLNNASNGKMRTRIHHYVIDNVCSTTVFRLVQDEGKTQCDVSKVGRININIYHFGS